MTFSPLESLNCDLMAEYTVLPALCKDLLAEFTIGHNDKAKAAGTYAQVLRLRTSITNCL